VSIIGGILVQRGRENLLRCWVPSRGYGCLIWGGSYFILRMRLVDLEINCYALVSHFYLGSSCCFGLQHCLADEEPVRSAKGSVRDYQGLQWVFLTFSWHPLQSLDWLVIYFVIPCRNQRYALILGYVQRSHYFIMRPVAVLLSMLGVPVGQVWYLAPQQRRAVQELAVRLWSTCLNLFSRFSYFFALNCAKCIEVVRLTLQVWLEGAKCVVERVLRRWLIDVKSLVLFKRLLQRRRLLQFFELLWKRCVVMAGAVIEAIPMLLLGAYLRVEFNIGLREVLIKVAVLSLLLLSQSWVTYKARVLAFLCGRRVVILPFLPFDDSFGLGALRFFLNIWGQVWIESFFWKVKIFGFQLRENLFLNEGSFWLELGKVLARNNFTLSLLLDDLLELFYPLGERVTALSWRAVRLPV